MKTFNELTGLYSISKTVEMAAIPEPKTAEVFAKWWENASNTQNEDNLFSLDQNISLAKDRIKKILNNLHENFINYALSKKEIVELDFFDYLEAYRNKNTEEVEGNVCDEIGKHIHSCVEIFLKPYIEKLPEKKAQKFNNFFKIKKTGEFCCVFGIMEMRELLECNPSLCPHDMEEAEYNASVKDMKGFWHALDTFFQNKNNYYVFNKDAQTSVITRIVSDLLPTYCANILTYEDRHEAYNSMYEKLAGLGINMKIKNPRDGTYDYFKAVDLGIFDIKNFGGTLTQKHIELYNIEISKLNEVVNLYNQQFAGTTGFHKLKQFVTLHKQIGCKPSVVPLSIELETFYEKDLENPKDGKCRSLEALIQVIKDHVSVYTSEQEKYSAFSLAKYLEGRNTYIGVYMNDKAIDLYLRKYTADAYSIKNKLKSEKKCTIYNKSKQEGEQVKWNSAVELSPLFECMDSDYDFDTAFKSSVYKDFKDVLDSSKTISSNFMALLLNEFETARKNARDFRLIENLAYDNQDNNAKLFQWLDFVLDVCRFVGSFNISRNKTKGTEPDTDLMLFVEHILEPNWFGWYAAIDAFVSRKPQDNVKDNQLRLNFGTSSFMEGWSVGEEEQKLSCIVKKDSIYYLCVLKNKKLFAQDNDLLYNNADGSAKRMIIKKLNYSNITGKGYVRDYGIKYTEEVDGKAIEHVKQRLKKDYISKYPKLATIVDGIYTSKKELKKATEAILSEYSQIEMIPVNWDYLKSQEGVGVYIFKLYNKDFSKDSSGHKNLFTLYWEDPFTGNSLHRIAAYAKLFVRNAAGKEQDTIIHKVGSFLINKRDKKGNVIPRKIYTELYNNKNYGYELKSQQAMNLLKNDLVVFKKVKEGHEIIKDKRFYSGRKYTFHCPIKFNEGAEDFPRYPETVYGRYDQLINSTIENPTFLGIDRGEKHLVYWCLLNSDGSINDCGNFDTINGTNYVQLLEERSAKRKSEQKERKQRSDIKNLKKSYINLITSEVSKMSILPTVLKKNAPMYIILEKLNKEMKGKRAHIEKQTYQAFELGLANKLSLFVEKNLSDGPGSIKQPLQLVPPFKTFDDIDGKDSFGIMQYTRANYTSVTDPLTGWRQTIYIQGGKSNEILQRIIAEFDDIRFDGKDYAFDYTDKNTGKKWTLYSGCNGKPLDRFYGYVKEAEEHYTRINVVETLDTLFKNYDKEHSLRSQLIAGVELIKKSSSTRTAADELRFTIKIIQQIRNTGNDIEDDNFLQSPVRDSDGRHFDTREAKKFEGLERIIDGDANGAYNIARKGYIMYKHRECWKNSGSPTYIPDKKKKKKEVPALNLFVSDREWDLWLQDKEEWQKQLEIFAIRKE